MKFASGNSLEVVFDRLVVNEVAKLLILFACVGILLSPRETGHLIGHETPFI